jgi:general secretion pathway protein G
VIEMKRNLGEEGFTLLEVLVVVAILGVLTTIVGPSLFKNVDKSRQVTARTQLEIFKVALSNYNLDTGGYPTTLQGLDALVKKPMTPPIPDNWDGPYIEKIPLDPWGSPYQYVSPGRYNKGSYDLWSMGKDGRDGGQGIEEDITNWED